MNSYITRIRNISILSGATLLLLGICWTLGVNKPLFAGLMLGTAVGVVNSLYTAYKINQLGKNAISDKPRRFATIGTSTRYATALLAAVIAMKNPETVSIAGTIIGLMTLPIVILAEGFTSLRKHTTSEERGEK